MRVAQDDSRFDLATGCLLGVGMTCVFVGIALLLAYMTIHWPLW